jgi:hypothetical protein
VRTVQLSGRQGRAGTGRAVVDSIAKLCIESNILAEPSEDAPANSYGSVIEGVPSPPELWRRPPDARVGNVADGRHTWPAGRRLRLRLDRFPEGCVLFGFAVARNAREGY